MPSVLTLTGFLSREKGGGGGGLLERGGAIRAFTVFSLVVYFTKQKNHH